MKYHISSRIIHWLMAFLIIGLLSLGIYMDNFLSHDAPNRFEIYSLHKSFGVIALVLIFVRIFNRFIQLTPALPEGLPKIEKIAAKITHFALYILMILMPLSGYLMSNSFGFEVHLFSLKMPNLIAVNPRIGGYFSMIHLYSAYTMIALLSLHIVGALKHRFFDKPENDVLKRML